MSTSIFPTAQEAQTNTKKADFQYLCGMEIFAVFKGISEASQLGLDSVQIEVCSKYLPNIEAAVSSKGYIITVLEEDLIQVEWASHMIRRASFQVIQGGSNE